MQKGRCAGKDFISTLSDLGIGNLNRKYCRFGAVST
jgi:hypothetical protein